MRKPSSSLASRVGELATLLLTASLCIVPEVAAINFTPAPSPNLDLSQLGRIALAGDFDALSLYEYVGQNQNSFSSNGSQSLLTRFPNGVFTALETADASIEAMCPYVVNGKLQGVVLGGNFTSLGGIQTQGIALFNPNTSAITPLPGLSGRVQALYCDDTSGMVYVGGSFSGGNSTNAIAWTSGWTNLPFAGFNGPVNSIVKASNGHIIFGGKFNGLGNTTTPKELDKQVIPIGSANITAEASTATAGFSDPRNIICQTGEDSAGNTWLLADNSPGSWTASFGFGFQPSKLRLYNTQFEGRGTKTWRFTALPLGGIMNLTYTTSTGEQAYCDARCPLPQSNNSYQDFKFVNTVGMNAFRIDISDWYGSGGGLSGIELFENDIYSFAVNAFNEPTCDSVSNGSTSINSTATGTAWTETPSGQSNANYLTTVLTGSNIQSSDAQVVFQPDIRQSGNYSVTIYTPGCVQDDTCSTRGRVNITGLMASGSESASQPVSTELFQTNNFDKYDQIYFGYVDANSGAFRPTVTLQPSSGQSGPLTVVAQRVRFELLTPNSGGINGLFDYNPSEAVVDATFNSTIDQAGTQLQDGATISSLAIEGNTTYVAGNFSTGNFSNIFSISGQNPVSLAGGGLNAAVSAIYQNNTTLYVGGNFTNTRDGKTTGLGGVAAYSTSDNTWQPLGAGVNGVVQYIVPFSLNITSDKPETVLAITGSFTKVLAFGDNKEFSAQDLAVWVPSQNNWLQNLDAGTMSISGQLIAQTEVPGFSPLFAGAVSSQALSASGSAGLNSASSKLGLQKLPVKIQPQQPSNSTSSKRKRALSAQSVNGAVTGLMYEQNNLNITVLAGHFAATGSNGSTINNLLYINGSNSDKVTGFDDKIDADSVFLSVATQGTVLYAGGSVSGKLSGNPVNGLVLYDLQAADYVPTQPAAFAGTSVAVNAIAPQPSATNVYVGGDFQSAGSLACPGLCAFDTKASQWNRPGDGLTGVVSALTWVSSSKLIVGGNLTVNGNSTSLATYNPKSSSFTEFPGAGSVPGPITALCPADKGASTFWVAGTANNGSAFLEKFDGSQFHSMGDAFGSGTTINGLQIFTLSTQHSKTDLLDANLGLLVLGAINLPNFGNASAALYNGTHFVPFLLSTTATNGQGSASSVFVQNPQNFFSAGGHKLAVGFIVLIGLAIALALTFILVVVGIVAERVRRRREGYSPAPTQMFDKNSNMDRIPPEHLFGTLGASQRAPRV